LNRGLKVSFDLNRNLPIYGAFLICSLSSSLISAADNNQQGRTADPLAGMGQSMSKEDAQAVQGEGWKDWVQAGRAAYSAGEALGAGVGYLSCKAQGYGSACQNPAAFLRDQRK
jgi:hypothetical protein